MTRARGNHWEKIAESFLNRRGLKTLHRNFQARFGEIDLVVLDGRTLVFVEVRYRRNASHGTGAESVTRHKQRRIISAALLYLNRNPRYGRHSCRFDVISIGTERGRTVLDWIQGAFMLD